MAIHVTEEVIEGIRNDPGTIHLQVRNVVDVEAATRALREAATDIANLDGGWQSAPGLRPGDTNGPQGVRVSSVATGPVLWVDGGATPAHLLFSIPDVVAKRFAEHEVTAAVITCPEPNDLFVELTAIRRSAFLRLFLPPVPGIFGPQMPMPMDWLAGATDWLCENTDGPLWVWMGSETFSMTRDAVVGSWEKWRHPGNWVRVVNNADPNGRVRGLNVVNLESGPELGLGEASTTASDADLLNYMTSLIALTRRLAPTLASAFADFGSFGGCLDLGLESHRVPHGGADGMRVKWLADELLLDSYPYQVLAPGHLARLAGESPPGVRPLGGGRAELFLGDPTAWLPGSPQRDRHREDGRRLLGPCLLSQDAANHLVQGRRHASANRRS